jgi:ankyrin repeat protein
MERPGGADRLALLIERSSPAPLDEPIIQLLNGRLLPQLATQDTDGNNALRRACFRKQFAAAKVFLDALSKQDPDIINEKFQASVNKRTLLHFAAMTGKHEILRFLLQNKACVGQADQDKMTAWDLAVRKRDYHAMCELAAHHISAGLEGHWYRQHVLRRAHPAPILTLTKNTDLLASRH